MSNNYEFTKLSAVEALAEVPENANALVEVDGAIKRVPGSGLGGDKGIKTAIIKSSDYDNALAGLQTAGSAAPAVTYTCLNMTFEEAYQTMASGEPLQAVIMMVFEGVGVGTIPAIVAYGNMNGVYRLLVGSIVQDMGPSSLYWTADGLSTEAPTA